MINTKPSGPAVRVVMFYGAQQVYELSGSDDDNEFAGLKPEQLAVAVSEQIIVMHPPKPRTMKREAA